MRIRGGRATVTGERSLKSPLPSRVGRRGDRVDPGARRLRAVVDLVTDYAQWLATCDVPKLLVIAEPGAILRGPQLEFCRTWPNQTELTVTGNHFLQEDSPDEIGAAIASFIAGHR